MHGESFGLRRNRMSHKKRAIWIQVCFCFLFPGILSAQTFAPILDLLPEQSTGIKEKKVVFAKEQMVASANRYISQAGATILNQGGNAVDAAIASAIMVTLVEPQSAGIGGGGFILYFDKKQQILTSFDGRETAPQAATETLFIDSSGRPLSYPDAVNNGRSVGVPGLLRALELMHQKYGKLPWQDLFAPTIELAERGFEVSSRLSQLVQKDPFLAYSENAKKYFYSSSGTPIQTGQILINLPLANTLKNIARSGARVFYEGQMAKEIALAVGRHPRPGILNEDDLKNYQAVERDVICGPYRAFKVCGISPPSSGGITLLQILGILESFPMTTYSPTSYQGIHYFSEAGRLAYADRDIYIADPSFGKVPVKELLAPSYLAQRAKLIRSDISMKQASAGEFVTKQSKLGIDQSAEIPSTSHLSIVDRQGNAVSMTLSVAAAFGSRIMVDGFFLNNEMTDFSFISEQNGLKIFNRVEPGKRPRSAMAPVMIFDQHDQLKMVVGSAGGPAIINYVAKTIMGVIDWGLNIQEAIALPNIGSRNIETDLEISTLSLGTINQLKSMGHPIKEWEMNSGTQGIWIDHRGLWGGVDPRREGVVVGQ